MLKEILAEIKEIKLIMGLHKKVFNINDFCLYTGMSKQHVYHLTSTRRIRFYRPCGKMIFFDVEDVIEFLKQNPVKTGGDKDSRINNYLLRGLK